MHTSSLVGASKCTTRIGRKECASHRLQPNEQLTIPKLPQTVVYEMATP